MTSGRELNLGGGNKNMVGGVYWGGNFSRWGDEQILGGGGESPHPPSRENPAM